jgi:hypothetical protein
MQRFRIKQFDEILINVTHKNTLVIGTIRGKFSSMKEIRSCINEKLPWNYKGAGRRIEISIHNLTKQESKYINTFS